jgi:hypothetical protein
MHLALRSLRFTLALALTLIALPALAATPVADVDVGFNSVTWTPHNEFAGLQLTVSGPDGNIWQNSFDANEAPQLDLSALGSTVDGLYTWELRATPIVDHGKMTAASRTSEAGTRVRSKDLPPRDSLIQNGSFRVVNGSIVQPATEQDAPGLVVDTPGVESATAGLERATAADNVVLDDQIVDGSLCVGMDCINGENFGFDTFRLKENNLRIHFEDTSNSGSFPSNDWRIIANGSQNGDPSYFRVEDSTAGRNPFTIEAGAHNNNLVVDSAGRIGIKTDTPAVDIHVKEGNTPTLRLEQDGSDGFSPQVYDIAGNEANFFIRDVTNGSRLFFRSKPGAPEDSIFIAADGDVGMGTDSPSSSLHVHRTNGSNTGLLVEETSSNGGLVLAELSNNGPVRFALTDTSTGLTWRWANGGNMFSIIDFSDPTIVEFQLNQDGDLTITGELFTQGSMCMSGCDLVFTPETDLASIEEHAEQMWANRHLPAVGPTKENETFNISRMTGGILNEVEMAHIYIEQLNDELKEKDEAMTSLQERLARIEAQLELQ